MTLQGLNSNKKGDLYMDMKIEKIPPYRIAYIRRIGAYGAANMETMEKLKDWAKSKDLFSDEKATLLAIAHDNPSITVPENCRYDACIVISNDYQIESNDQVVVDRVLGGKYAVFKIKHTAEEIQKVWNEAIPYVLNHGYNIDKTKPMFERYVIEMLNNHYCEFCVPIYS